MSGDRHLEIIARLKEKRIEKKVTQKKLASLLGTEQSRISELESGKAKLGVAYFLTIMEALGYTPNEVRFVLYGTRPKKTKNRDETPTRKKKK